MKDYKVIEGATNYAVTIDGEVINTKTKRILKQCHNGWAGYMQVGIKYDNSRRISKTVHRLVYEAFNGPIPNGLVINHKDEDKTNNSLGNLEAVTRAENIRYGSRLEKQKLSRKNGTGLRKEYAKNRKFTRPADVVEKHREITKNYWKEAV